MPTGSRVVPALFVAASVVAVVVTGIFDRTSILAVAGSCALGLVLVQGWRQNRSVMARLARMERRARRGQPAYAEAPTGSETSLQEHSQGQASTVIARLDRIQDQTDVAATHVRTLSESVNALIGRPAELRSFQDLSQSDDATSGSLTLDTLVPGEHTFRNLPLTSGRASVVLVLDALDLPHLDTNVKTALSAGLSAAEKLQRPLRVVTLTLAKPREEATAQLRAWVTEATDSAFQAGDVSLTPADAVTAEPFDPTDAWIVATWQTAHALSAACRNGKISATRVIYLVQDYAPGSLAWGSDHALAVETYRQGFHSLVNSASVAEALSKQTGTLVDPEHIFSPDLETTRLHDAAQAWKPGQAGEVRVLFDSRPSDARTMFSLGIAGLQRWVESLQDSGVRPIIYSAGELHASVDLGNGQVVESLGHLSPDTYHDLLSRVDLGLGLMHSPHPGHFALELPMAGIPTVSNTFESFRTTWVDGLHLAAATPSGIATALDEAHRKSQSFTIHTPASPTDELGRPMEEALHSILDGLTW